MILILRVQRSSGTLSASGFWGRFHNSPARRFQAEPGPPRPPAGWRALRFQIPNSHFVSKFQPVPNS